MTADDQAPRAEQTDSTAPAESTRGSRIRRAFGVPRRRVEGWAEGCGRTRRRRVLVVLATLCVAAAVATSALVILERAIVSSEADTAAAVEAARQRASTALTFQPATLDADLERGQQSTTGTFASDYPRLVGQLLAVVGRGTGVTTELERAGVVTTADGADGDTVTVLLLGRQTVTAPNLPAPRTSPTQLQVVVTRVAGQWLISDLDAV